MLASSCPFGVDGDQVYLQDSAACYVFPRGASLRGHGADVGGLFGERPSSASPVTWAAESGDYRLAVIGKAQRPAATTPHKSVPAKTKPFRYVIECRLPLSGLDRRLIHPSEEEQARAVAGTLDYRFNRARLHGADAHCSDPATHIADEGLTRRPHPAANTFHLRTSRPSGETTVMVGADTATIGDVVAFESPSLAFKRFRPVVSGVT